MPYLRLQDILRPTTQTDTELFLDQFYTKFDSGNGANKKIINVEPLYYQGVIAGTEFLVYAANKLYIAYSLSIGITNLLPLLSYAILYDELNADTYYIGNMAAYFNQVTMQTDIIGNYLELKNNYFSRIGILSVTQFRFIGYRITLI